MKWFDRFRKKAQSDHDTTPSGIFEKIVRNVYSSYVKRRFDGEKFDGGMNYSTAYGADVYKMRERSIRAYSESMQARAVVKRLADTVINTGLTLESTPASAILGLSQEERQAISRNIESRFNLWCNSKSCDASFENTLGQIEKIQFNNQVVKGDYFAVLNFNVDNPELINPLQIKIIRPENVSTPTDASMRRRIEDRGNHIVDGVEFNDNDEEVTVYVKSKKPKSFLPEWTLIPIRSPVTGRVVVAHGKTQEFGSEPRGVPALAHVAHELEKITDYSLLELMAAVANATIALVVEPGDGAPATNPFPNNSFVPPNVVKSADGWETTDDSNLDPGYTNIGKNVFKNSGGFLVSSLNAGEKLASHDTKRPNVNFESFVDSITKYLAASLSIPIEILHMKFGSNFSASRASLKLYWQSVAVWRQEFVSDFLTPVYNAWLLGEVSTGNLILPGFEDPILRAAWQSAAWVGVPSPSIDPFKEERAAQIRVKEGFRTREQEAQRVNGSFDSNVERLRSENERLAEANEPIAALEEAAA